MVSTAVNDQLLIDVGRDMLQVTSVEFTLEKNNQWCRSSPVCLSVGVGFFGRAGLEE